MNIDDCSFETLDEVKRMFEHNIKILHTCNEIPLDVHVSKEN